MNQRGLTQVVDIIMTAVVFSAVGFWLGARAGFKSGYNRGFPEGVQFSVHNTWLAVQKYMDPDDVEQFKQAVLTFEADGTDG